MSNSSVTPDELAELRRRGPNLTDAELLELAPALQRAEWRRQGNEHEAARRRRTRPDVPLHVWNEGQARALEGKARQSAALSVALASTGSAVERLEAARAAVAALPRELERYAPQPARAFKRGAAASLSELARVVKAALEQLAPGAPPCARGNPAVYVQQEDLEDLVPDGWGRTFPLEVTRLGRRAGVAPLAVPLLCLLTWVSETKPSDDGRRCGTGFQVSLAWLARKLGCSLTWTKELLNRLDPHAAWRRECAVTRRENRRRARRGRAPKALPQKPPGTPYVQRFRRCVSFAAQRQRGAHQGAWVDRTGRPRLYVDVRGVCYVTDAGRALLVRRKHRELPKPGTRPELRRNLALEDLRMRLLDRHRQLGRRLGKGCGESRGNSNGSHVAGASPP